MAKWQFNITALEVTGQDEHGWPIARIVNMTTHVDESNIIRLYKTARQVINDNLPNNYNSFVINNFDRVDKKTNKDYGSFNEDAKDLRVVLTPDQKNTLEKIQNEIWIKAIGGGQTKEAHNLFFDYSDEIRYITDEVAFFNNHIPGRNGKSTALSHEESAEHIAAIQRFYSRITPAELDTLFMDTNWLTQPELEVVRSLL